MAHLEDIAGIIAAVGPEIPEVEGVLMRASDEWLLRFADIDIAIEFGADTDRLVLSAELGEVPLARRLDVFTALMTYSLLWRDTGGLYVGLANGRVPILLLSLAGGEVTSELMVTVLQGFTTRARILRTFVESADSEGAAMDIMTGGGIRA